MLYEKTGAIVLAKDLTIDKTHTNYQIKYESPVNEWIMRTDKMWATGRLIDIKSFYGQHRKLFYAVIS